MRNTVHQIRINLFNKLVYMGDSHRVYSIRINLFDKIFHMYKSEGSEGSEG